VGFSAAFPKEGPRGACRLDRIPPFDSPALHRPRLLTTPNNSDIPSCRRSLRGRPRRAPPHQVRAATSNTTAYCESRCADAADRAYSAAQLGPQPYWSNYRDTTAEYQAALVSRIKSLVRKHVRAAHAPRAPCRRRAIASVAFLIVRTRPGPATPGQVTAVLWTGPAARLGRGACLPPCVHPAAPRPDARWWPAPPQGAVVASFKVFEDFNAWNATKKPVYLQEWGVPLGGHAMTIVGAAPCGPARLPWGVARSVTASGGSSRPSSCPARSALPRPTYPRVPGRQLHDARPLGDELGDGGYVRVRGPAPSLPLVACRPRWLAAFVVLACHLFNGAARCLACNKPLPYAQLGPPIRSRRTWDRPSPTQSQPLPHAPLHARGPRIHSPRSDPPPPSSRMPPACGWATWAPSWCSAAPRRCGISRPRWPAAPARGIRLRATTTRARWRTTLGWIACRRGGGRGRGRRRRGREGRGCGLAALEEAEERGFCGRDGQGWWSRAEGARSVYPWPGHQ
jgi:hypothetical protein